MMEAVEQLQSTLSAGVALYPESFSYGDVEE
jgi:hypothetical protein